ncbi:hypothetical protein GPECTOR_102g50 [Gonium pectorale]|uniref:Nodulin-like domain-containing protein n=1 Tax=Gonium pectorale TaxID=33097 RepID=A0A150FZT1_GONPE|nr:hypothetical protein GPECTOR_102g50 [Gonium pectorale]|eukprot:KXZ43097.1 hypothetical protein GPECTOR_102g50 [Gonium pectorale]
MVEGGVASGPGVARLRIKGKAASVVRFFAISVAFTVLWILVTSQLGHYSKLFGPQILLQLNLAFYLPSIPVLLLSGSLERALDARLGPIGSIAARLNAGLGGCLALAALFPLLPGLRPGDGPLWLLLGAVGVLGGLSAVAFSTAYQLVQFFRAADTIGLGVGCVGSGPLVLLVQLALRVGPSPARWQWIAMFEVSAGFIAVGLLSSASLCGQYWPRLMAATRGAAAAAGGDDGGAGDGRVPLLSAADLASDAEAGGDRGQLGASRAPASPPGLRPLSSGGAPGRTPQRLTRRPTTAPDPFNVFSLLTHGLDGGFDWAGDDDADDSSPPLLLRRSASVGEHISAAAARRRQALAAVRMDSGHGEGPPPPRAGTGTFTSVFASSSAAEPVEAALWEAPAEAGPPGGVAAGDLGNAGGAGAGAGAGAAGAAEGAAQGVPPASVGFKCEAEAGLAAPRSLTVQEEVAEVVRDSWQVLLGFLVSVTILYVVFPFFTYVPTSGWLGDSLPQALFYSRLFTDLAGRLLPRRRALQLRSGGAVLVLAAVATAAAGLFFAYILAPPGLVARAPRLLRNDVVPLALVVFLWLTGGYTNTMSNMLAPSMVAPDLAGRASAIMALLFNVGHIGGLMVAAAGAAAVFGDVVG